MEFTKRRTLTGGGAPKKGDGVVGVVKQIDNSPKSSEKRVKVKMEDNSNASIYVPKKFAKDLKPEHSYEFHLDEPAFRGGGQQRRFSSTEMARRTDVAPTEVRQSRLGKITSRNTDFSNRW
ncbi:MAG: hypothetical protein H6867_05330 [Rhodospirillales bacterium]|nr:hypothetical protein [Rhodospirillales bacterium]MCB9994951.1 hypothetical protein [Rhodospirillales bacterium]